jgi:DNA polymerase elongation subunit (family B)
MSQGISNYVAVWLDHTADKVIVLERDSDGVLTRVQHSVPYYFYVEADGGAFTSIFGESLAKIELRTRSEYDAAKQHARSHGFKLFESDIYPVKRLLMDRYYDRPTPPVNYVFLDIEVDYQSARGFAGPTNPYAPINAITVYQSWTRSFLTAVVPSPGWIGTHSDLQGRIQQLINNKELRPDHTPEIHICLGEIDLVNLMLGWIAEADIVSGWNSEFYDLPYICERLRLLGGEQLLGRLDHPGVRAPKKDTMSRFGSEHPVYKLTGKSHIDYMRVFQKFTSGGRVSYSLGNILEEEVDVGKLEYDGTLEQLYKNDLPSFVAYNFRDVDGLVQLDAKHDFIALINQLAHENTVSFDAILGTVSYVETGITNYAHHKLNRIVRDKAIKKSEHVEGAVVLTPKAGLHHNLGSVDVSSLYPNTIRSLNISPEKIVGQFTEKEQAWHEIRKRSDANLTLVLDNGESATTTAMEWRDLLFQSKWVVSGFGTVFDQGAGRGLVPEVLGYWYAERRRFQAEKKKYAKLAQYENDAEKQAKYLRLEAHFNLQQLTKKISMNSVYGAMLSPGFRFGDERLGASTTGTGRQITTHMVETIAYRLTGERHEVQKTIRVDKKGRNHNEYCIGTRSIIYGDTDSCYFNTGGETVDDAIAIADGIAEHVNDTFPTFMREACLCQPEFDNFISVNREIVGTRGLFLNAKKKYTIKVVDKEGIACNELKTTGSEIKKSDTPKVIQRFMSDLMTMILDSQPPENVAYFIITQRHVLFDRPESLFQLGVARQVNNLQKYVAEYNEAPRVPNRNLSRQPKGRSESTPPGRVRKRRANRRLTIPGHCRAALNYNRMIAEHEIGAKQIRSGDKALIFRILPKPFSTGTECPERLPPTQYTFDTMALPAESIRFPKWFTELFDIDTALTALKMFDSKLDVLFEALAAEASCNPERTESFEDILALAGQYSSLNSPSDFLIGAKVLFARYRGPYDCYGFEDTWAFLRTMYGDRPRPQLVDEFTTQIKNEGLL